MSARNLSNFAESAMAVNRVIAQHFSMNYSYMERPAGALRHSKSCHPTARRCAPGGAHLLEEETPLGLSPPTESELMRRRLQLTEAPPVPLPVH